MKEMECSSNNTWFIRVSEDSYFGMIKKNSDKSLPLLSYILFPLRKSEMFTKHMTIFLHFRSKIETREIEALCF